MYYLLTGMKLPEAFDFAISNAYEYYAKHAVFADEPDAFESLNTPDYKNANQRNSRLGMSQICRQVTVWVLLNSDNFEDALTLASGMPGEPMRIMPPVGAVAGLM